MIRTKVLLLIGAWLLAAPAVGAKPPVAAWTVMVYMAGDNDLEPAIVKDLELELGKVGSSPQVQVLALADRIPGHDARRGNWSDTQLFHVQRGLQANTAQAVAHWGERNMGDPETLLRFVRWAKTHYPAQRYALFLWGHGWNWRPGYTLADETAQDALNPDEIQGILSELRPLDLVAYDGCSMGSIEVDALWYGHAQAIVHSQEYVDWEGLAYDRILTALQAQPHLDALALAKIVNQSARSSGERTGSAVVLDARFRQVLQALDRWSEVLIQGLPQYHTAYQQAFQHAGHFSETPEDYDLWDLVTQILQRVPDPQLQARGQALQTALQAALIDEWHQPEYPFAHGLSISGLTPNDPHEDYYHTLDLARYSRWGTFLRAYHAMSNRQQ